MALGLTCMALMLLICMLATPIAATPTRHHAARPLALSNIDVRADNPQVGGSGITQQESLEGKGDELIRLMNSPQDQVPQSQWTRWEEAQDWGWRTYMYSENNLKAKLEQLETDMPMFPQFGWSNQPSHWEGITAAHIRESKHANMTYPTTQAQCSCLIGTRDGVLIVLARTSPAKSVEESELDVRPDRMPLLCYSSDMLYLLWDSVVDGSQKIKHVLIHNIINKDTKGVMLQALRKQPPEWPGERFDINSVEGERILATANGKGIAYLLAQHKDNSQLGMSAIDSATLFASGPSWARAYNIYFHVSPIETS